jgi:hypothetical protein
VQILKPLWSEAAPTAHFRYDKNAVSIEKYCTASSDARIDYHLVCLICSLGWLTRQCQTTDWNASDKGVIREALT